MEVRNADIMATLIKLKREVEDHVGHSIKMTFTGAAEAHLLAKELAAANIGVIVTPPRSFPYTWEEQRMCVIYFSGVGMADFSPERTDHLCMRKARSRSSQSTEST